MKDDFPFKSFADFDPKPKRVKPLTKGKARQLARAKFWREMHIKKSGWKKKA